MVLSPILSLPFGLINEYSMRTIFITIVIFLNACFLVTAQKNRDLLKTERVYLHTDRNSYIAGDYLFYSLYLNGESAYTSKYAYLIIRDQNNSLVTGVRLEIENRKAFGSVFLPDTLNTGVYQIVCYTNSMRNESEENYFTKEIVIANRFDEKLTQFPDRTESEETDGSDSEYSFSEQNNENLIIYLNKQEFNQREKITIEIVRKGADEDSISRISVSISEIIPGFRAEPSISDYISHKSKEQLPAEGNQFEYSYLPEISGAVLQGKIVSAAQSGIIADSIRILRSPATKNYTLLVSTIDSISNLQYTTTNSDGSFNLLLNPYYDGKDLIVRLKENVNALIEPDNKFILKQPFIPSGFFNVPNIREYLARSVKIAQIKKFYGQKESLKIVKGFFSSGTIPRVYYKSYPVIYPSDFVELTDFIDISKEIIPALKVWKVREKYVCGYLNLQNHENINTEPAIFLDGIQIDDINQIIYLGSGDIKSIQSLNVVRYFGEMSFTGILSLFSKNLVINYIHFKTPVIKYQALSSQPYTEPEPFKTANKMDHNPDLRQLLLWEPDNILKKNETVQLVCYASDLTGRYHINIQGITANGKPLSASAVFIIKPKLK